MVSRMISAPTKIQCIGAIIGFCIVASIFNPFISLLPSLVIILLIKSRYSKLRIVVFSISIVLIAWILIKSSMVGSLGYRSLIPIYPLAMMAILSIKVINRQLIEGVYYPIAILFAVDIIFNLSSLWFGSDLLGRTPSFRADGNRYGGVMGHSFFSIAISASFMLLATLLNRSKWYRAAGIINMLLSGSMRAYIYLGCYFIYATLLHRIKWKAQIVAALLVVSGVVCITFLSVMQGWVHELSGNGFRLFAWGNALSAIAENPFSGSWNQFVAWDSDAGVTIENITSSGTTESVLLGDVLFWGVFSVAGKLLIIYVIGSCLSLYASKRPDEKESTILAFLPFVMLVDYCIGSLWGNMLVAYVLMIMLSYGISKANKRLYVPSNKRIHNMMANFT